MEWLNYHHLLYFWVVAKEGSVTRASKQLLLAQPTLSGQIRALEDALGEKLFHRQGRRLVLTETGRLVYGYADEIFTLGRELMDVLRGRPAGRPVKLMVGVADHLPKLITYHLLRPAFEMAEPVHLVCTEDNPQRLLSELSTQGLDLILSDSPLSPGAKVRAYNHLLGECGVTIFGAPPLAGRLRADFPKSLEGVPFLLPIAGSELRRSLEQWFDANGIRPTIAGEFQDSALIKVFGQAGMGVFAAPTIIEGDVSRTFDVEVIGRPGGLTERFYAISVERRLKHPAVVAISQAARSRVFAREVQDVA